MKKSLSLLALALLGTGLLYAEESSVTVNTEQSNAASTEMPVLALEEIKLEESKAPTIEGAAQPAAQQPAVAAKPTNVATPAATPAAPATGASQTFEESLDLVPRGSGAPEVSAAPTQAAPVVPEEKPAAPVVAKPQGPTLEEAVAQAQAPKNDDETCTTLCKKVCLGLKEQEVKILEEDSEPAEKPAISAELPGFIDIK